MNRLRKLHWVLVLGLAATLLTSCGAEETPTPITLVISTAVPVATATPRPTSTSIPLPTLKPIPFDEILVGKGFELDPAGTCPDEACTIYKHGSDITVSVYQSGKFSMMWTALAGHVSENNDKYALFQNVVRALYPADVAAAVIGRDMKHSGEVGGYIYEFKASGIGIGDAITVTVSPAQ